MNYLKDKYIIRRGQWVEYGNFVAKGKHKQISLCITRTTTTHWQEREVISYAALVFQFDVDIFGSKQ